MHYDTVQVQPNTSLAWTACSRNLWNMRHCCGLDWPFFSFIRQLYSCAPIMDVFQLLTCYQTASPLLTLLQVDLVFKTYDEFFALSPEVKAKYAKTEATLTNGWDAVERERFLLISIIKFRLHLRIVCNNFVQIVSKVHILFSTLVFSFLLSCNAQKFHSAQILYGKAWRILVIHVLIHCYLW